MKIAVLDESIENADKILSYVTQNNISCSLNLYSNIFALVTAIYDEFKGSVDVILIHLEEKNDRKISMARDMQKYYPQLRVVFYSENNDMAEEIFQAYPLCFFKIPFDNKKIKHMFDRICEVIKNDCMQTLSIRMRGQLFKINFSSIKYIESSARKVIFYTEEGAFETYMTMDKILEELPKCFMRCHRSYIVNTEKITKLGNNGVVLYGREIVPVSKTYIHTIRENMIER